MFDFFKNKKKEVVPGDVDGLWYSGIISELADAVFVYDPDFKIKIFNKAAESVFNLRGSEVLGVMMSLDKAREPRLKFLVQVIFPSLAPNVVLHSEPGVYPQMADMHFGDTHLRVITNKIIDGNGMTLGFTKVIHDRTREIGILKSKSEFLNIAAHQLRTPLTAINWAFDGLVKEANLDDSAKQLVDTGSAASKKLLKISDDLLDIAKLEEGKFGYSFKEGDLAVFLEKILSDERAMADSYGVKLYFNKPSGLLTLSFDEQKLALAVINLLDNAIKYNVPNGSVVLTVSRLPDQPYIIVAVQDTGLGIPKKDIDKMFTKFFRAENAIKASTEGSGLGLYLVKNVIERHGGRIWVESEINRGSTFYFTLATDPKLIPIKETAPEEF